MPRDLANDHAPASPSVSPIAEAPELMPCPFCGSEKINVNRDDEDNWIVQCDNKADVCPMIIQVIDAFARENAIAAWNRRASPVSDVPTCAQCGDNEPLQRCPSCGNDLCSTCITDPCDHAARSVPLSGASDTTSEPTRDVTSEDRVVRALRNAIDDAEHWAERAEHEGEVDVARRFTEDVATLKGLMPSRCPVFLTEEDMAGLPEWPSAPASSETTSEEAKQLRRLLFLSHPCSGKYGDDGELQCASCRIDFKRDSVEHIDLKLIARGMKLMDALLSSPSPSILQKDTTANANCPVNSAVVSSVERRSEASPSEVAPK